YDNEIIIEEDNFQEEKFGNNKPDNSEIRKENKEKIMADKFESKKFRHDNISKNNNKTDLSSKIQTKSIKDINSVIGMNDKFVFIRELFAGDNQQYRDTIQVLNNFDSYENAYNFLSENFNWNLDDANVSKLLEILKRRYL
ncbi:MAG: hypothetical protein U9R54_03240, partial [Bacteroidota bacterium]|nr:hypothetical protein [Bacteroidota bacterium]